MIDYTNHNVLHSSSPNPRHSRTHILGRTHADLHLKLFVQNLAEMQWSQWVSLILLLLSGSKETVAHIALGPQKFLQPYQLVTW